METKRKKRLQITLSTDTVERLQQYAWENHLNGYSAAITDLTWNAKVKNAQLRGQMSIGDT